MGQVKKNRRTMSEINMVPFIDIMMVLLVAFMISAPMLTQGIKVELPKTSSNAIPLPEDKDLLILSVSSKGEYYMDLDSTRDTSLQLSVITDKVAKVVSARPDIQVLVKGDAHVEYGSVIELMSGIQAVGVANVGLITDPVVLEGK